MSDQPIAPWTVEGFRHLVRDRWISLRADRCRTDGGEVLDPYYVLEYRDFVQVVAIDRDDRLVLVEQYRHGLGTVSLECAGGLVDEGEEPLVAARRELREETGYTATRWRSIGWVSPNPAAQTNRAHIFLAEDAWCEGGTLDDPTEELRVVRLPVAEAVERAKTGGIVHALHVCSLALALGAIGRW